MNTPTSKQTIAACLWLALAISCRGREPVPSDLVDDAVDPSRGPAFAAVDVDSLDPGALGHVRFVGDIDVSGCSEGYAEELPGTCGAFLDAPRMGVPRAAHTAMALDGARVLIFGGIAPDATVLDSAEIFDVRDGSWTRAAQMPEPRRNATSVKLQDGRVLVLGGFTRGGASGLEQLADPWIYDPSSDEWLRAARPRLAHAGGTATVLLDGRVLVVGGYALDERVGGAATTFVEIYDPARDAWTQAPSLAQPRVGHAAVLLADGRVLVVGGSPDGLAGDPSAFHRDAEIFVPISGAWQQAGTLAVGRMEPRALRLRDGSVLVVGGTPHGQLRVAERFDPATSSWRGAGAMKRARYGHELVELPDGSALVLGGIVDAREGPFPAEVFDPKDGAWYDGATMPTNPSFLQATALTDGRVLVTGVAVASREGVLDNAFLYARE